MSKEFDQKECDMYHENLRENLTDDDFEDKDDDDQELCEDE
jgi:hypothetical protein